MPLQTERTDKRFKLLMAAGAAFAAAGAAWIRYVGPEGAAAVIIGALTFAIGKAGAWWHNG